MTTRIEIIVVGNEILSGEIQDTNSNWLAKQIYEMGGSVSRITVVGDKLDEIASAIRDSIRRGSKWIVTCGGLGPTFDDLTLEGVARATRRKLHVNKVALSWLAERYKVLKEMGVVESEELTPHRIKMAKLPMGAKPLRNVVGTAPGVLLSIRGTRIVCLPGVPAEMREMFSKEVRPLMEKSVRRTFRSKLWVLVKGVPESTLAPRIDVVMKRAKGIYVKSHPQGFEGGVSKIILEVIAEGRDIETVEDRLARTKEVIERELVALKAQEFRFSTSREF